MFNEVKCPPVCPWGGAFGMTPLCPPSCFEYKGNLDVCYKIILQVCFFFFTNLNVYSGITEGCKCCVTSEGAFF